MNHNLVVRRLNWCWSSHMVRFHGSQFQLFSFLAAPSSNLPELPNARKADYVPQTKNQDKNLGSLFHEIFEILGTESTLTEQTPTGTSNYGEALFVKGELNLDSSERRPSVSQNAGLKIDHVKDNQTVSEDNRLALVSDAVDVSPVVHRVAAPSSNLPELPNARKADYVPQAKNQDKNLGSLFHEIFEISGTENTLTEKTPTGISNYGEAHFVKGELNLDSSERRPSVSQNAELKIDHVKDNQAVSEDNRLELVSDAVDVSPVVHRVAAPSSNLPELPNARKADYVPQTKNQDKNLGSLFHEIFEILGTEHTLTEQTPTGISNYGEAHFVKGELNLDSSDLRPCVSQNAGLKIDHVKDNQTVSEDNRLALVSDAVDVSPVVHRVAAPSSNLPELPNARKADYVPQAKNQDKNLGSLFHEIFEILGTENTLTEQTPTGISNYGEAHFVKGELNLDSSERRPSVSQNAELKIDHVKDNQTVSEDNRLALVSDAVDVSPVVHRVAAPSSNLPELPNARKADYAPQTKNQRVDKNLGSLFHEILGTENTLTEQTSTGISNYGEAHFVKGKLNLDSSEHRPCVSQNAGLKIDHVKDNQTVSEDNRLALVSDAVDVSPVVHRVATPSSNLPKLPNARKGDYVPQTKNQRVDKNLGSLFHEIFEILGTENTLTEQTPTDISNYGEAHFVKGELNLDSLERRPCVSQNAGLKIDHVKDNQTVSEDNRLALVSDAVDVSPVVHRVAAPSSNLPELPNARKADYAPQTKNQRVDKNLGSLFHEILGTENTLTEQTPTDISNYGEAHFVKGELNLDSSEHRPCVSQNAGLKIDHVKDNPTVSEDNRLALVSDAVDVSPVVHRVAAPSSNLPELPNARKADYVPQTKNQRVDKNLGSLFHEIFEILGTENTLTEQTPTGISNYGEAHFVKGELNFDSSEHRPCVSQNAGLKIDHVKDNQTVSEDNNRLALVSDAVDVSPVVHRVTEIVRGGNVGSLMEEMLENLCVEYNEEIVDKVLKRCFKVPHLAFRFFRWIRLRKGLSLSNEIFNTMIYICGEAKEFRLVEELLQEMEANSIEKNIKTWTILIHHYGKAKLISRALLAFENMKQSAIEPDATAYKVMLHSLCKAGKADIALEFYKDIVHMKMGLSMGMYQKLLKCLALSGDVTSAYNVTHDMIKDSEIPESLGFGLLLKSFCISGQIGEALKLIQYLKDKNVSLGSELFETLVKGLCRADMIADALEIVDIMKKMNLVDGKIYGIIINGYLRRNDVSQALIIFRIMKDAGYLPSVSIFTNLIQYIIRVDDFQKALELYDEMTQMGVQLDSVAITAIAVGFIRQNLLPEAWKVLKTIEEKGLKATRKSCAVLIKELRKVSNSDDITKILNGRHASQSTKNNFIFQQVVSYLAGKGEMKKAEKVKPMQSSFTFFPRKDELDIADTHTQQREHNVHSQIVQGCMDSTSKEPVSMSYSKNDSDQICQVLSSSLNWDSVQEKLDKSAVQFTPALVVDILHNCNIYGGIALQFLSWVGKQAGYTHNTETYNMAIKISGRGKDFKHMRTLFNEMKRRGVLVTSDTWTIMIMLYGRTGLTDIAHNIFMEMKASGCKPNESTYKFLILSLCGKKGRKVDLAIKIFKEMIRKGCFPDIELTGTYLSSLCESGKLSEARSCIKSLRKLGFTDPLACSLYIRALCRAGNLDEALSFGDVYRPQEKHILDQYTFGSLVHGLLRAGREEEALAKVNSMKQIGINPTVHVYTSLIVHSFRKRDLSKALETIEMMKRDGCQPTTVTYSAIVRGYMDMEKISEAWDVFNQMRANGPLPDFRSYSMFITCLCKTGRSEEALVLISDMLDFGIIPSDVNYRTVFFGLNREGKNHLAQNVVRKKVELKKRSKLQT